MIKDLILMAIAVFMSYFLSAQNIDSCHNCYCPSRLELGAEYMHPIHKDREIETVSLNAFYWKNYFRRIKLNVNLGFTATYASGNITQWDENFHDVTYKTSAFGMGPILGLQLILLSVKRISVEGELNEGFILYSNKFPHGGDIYNFMYRRGVNIIYKAGNTYSVKLGYRFMHVSNGQGLGPQNPSYEARGISVNLVKYYKK